MSVETGVFALLSAAHRDPDGAPLHGHTWKVTAWVGVQPIVRDGRLLKAELQGILTEWDHTVLPDRLTRAEALCEEIGRRLHGCTEVVIERAEGFLARWRP